MEGCARVCECVYNKKPPQIIICSFTVYNLAVEIKII